MVRTDLVRVGQNRTGQGGSEQNWSGWVRTQLVRVDQNTTGQGGVRMEQVRVGSEQNRLNVQKQDTSD